MGLSEIGKSHKVNMSDCDTKYCQLWGIQNGLDHADIRLIILGRPIHVCRKALENVIESSKCASGTNILLLMLPSHACNTGKTLIHRQFDPCDTCCELDGSLATHEIFALDHQHNLHGRRLIISSHVVKTSPDIV